MVKLKHYFVRVSLGSQYKSSDAAISATTLSIAYVPSQIKKTQPEESKRQILLAVGAYLDYLFFKTTIREKSKLEKTIDIFNKANLN